jgi:hypothetical protein
MKQYPPKGVAIGEVIAGDGFASKLGLPCVSKVVHALRLKRAVHPIVVRSRDLRVVTGEDSLAAHVVLGSDTVMVVPVDLDESEFIALRTADEARISLGRPAETAAVEALLDQIEGTFEAKPRVGSHAPKSPRSLAREAVAELIGTTAQALRKNDDRRKRRARVHAPMVTKAEPWKLEVYGNHASPELLEDTAAIHEAFVKMDAMLRSAQVQVTRVKETRLGETRANRLHSTIHQAAALARSLMPHALCPYCKDVAVVRETCAACWGSGFVNLEAFKLAADELKLHKCVSHGGQFVDPKTLKPFKFPKAKVNQVYAAFDESAPDYVDEEEPPREWTSQAEPNIEVPEEELVAPEDAW